MRIARGRLGGFLGTPLPSFFYPRECGIGPRGLGFRGEGGMWEVGSERRDEVCGGGGAWMGGLGLDVCVYGFRRDGEKRTKKVEV